MSDQDKISDLEHKLIYGHIENLEFKIHEGFGAIAKNIDANFEIYRAENRSDNEKSEIQRDAILAEQKRTNGRVTKLEEVTSLLKVMQDNKKITALILYAIYNILDISTIENVTKFFKWLNFII